VEHAIPNRIQTRRCARIDPDLTLVAGGAACGGRTAAPVPATGRRRGPGKLTPPKVGPARRAVAGLNTWRWTIPPSRFANALGRHARGRRIIISVGSPTNIAAEVNTCSAVPDYRCSFSADLEWGAAMRVVGATAFPYIMAAGATAMSATPTRSAGRRNRGGAVGIHVKFRPDADVNNNPLNPIIKHPSFGRTPRPSRASVRGYCAWAADKRDARHAETLPGPRRPRMRTRNIGLPAIGSTTLGSTLSSSCRSCGPSKAGAQVVMSAHIAFPHHGGRPRRCLPRMLTGVMRDSLRFKGLVVNRRAANGRDCRQVRRRRAAVRAFEAAPISCSCPLIPIRRSRRCWRHCRTGRLTPRGLDSSVAAAAIKRQLHLFGGGPSRSIRIARIVGSSPFRMPRMTSRNGP